MLRFLFLDLDDTILDFRKAEYLALKKTLGEFGIVPTDAVCARYSQINQEHWERLERKELTRAQVLVGRFAQLFSEMGVVADPKAAAEGYAENLGIGHYFLPGAREAVESLAKKYSLYIVSNGTAKVQEGRLAHADITRFFGDIFISQAMGADKPDRLFFDNAFARIPDFDPSQAMIVGDSLTSDIQGGKNAGIRTCWVNPAHKVAPPHIVPDYQIEGISQLEALLETV